MQIDQEDFDRKFQVLENAGDGNCLFLAISQLDDSLDHAELRKAVCSFYKKLKKDKDFYVDEDSLVDKLRTQMVWDNIEYHALTGKRNVTMHDQTVCTNFKHAGIMDVIASAIILQRPIHVYQKLVFRTDDSANRRFKFDIYDDENIRSNPPIELLYNGTNHFEALIPSTSPSPKPKTPSANKKVLVLCQLKEGSCNDATGLSVEHSVIPIIERYLSNYLKTEKYTIEYLAPLSDDKGPGDKVDFNIKISEDSKTFKKFLEKHRKHYSVIVLNTCPFMLMKFGLISDLLSDTGVLVLSKVCCADLYRKRPDLFDIPPSAILGGNLNTFFEYKSGGLYTKIKSAAKGKRKRDIKPAVVVTRKKHMTRSKIGGKKTLKQK